MRVKLWLTFYSLHFSDIITGPYEAFLWLNEGGGRLTKNIGHHGWPTTKIKKNWLKSLKQSSKSKFGPKYKWLKMSFLEIFFWKYYFGHTTFLYSSKRSNGHHQSFFLISDFLAESLKANKNNTVSLKKHYSFYESQLTWHWK